MVQIKDLSKSRETVREYNGLQAGAYTRSLFSST